MVVRQYVYGLILSLFCAGTAYAGQVTASSCSRADVVTAIGTAVDGDYVTVPSGTCTWSSAISVTNKQIAIKGAGHGCTFNKSANGTAPASCTGTATNITANSGAFLMTNNSKGFRIAGFRFNNDGTGGNHTITVTKDNAYLNDKNTRGFRIDHNYFNGTTGHISINGARNFGVADTNIFYAPGGAQLTLFWGRGKNEIEGTSTLSILSGQEAHTDPVQLGTNNAFYIENNELYSDQWQGGQNIGDGTAGQRVVVRYNVIRGMFIENHGACSGQARGTYWQEVYENDYYPYNWNGSSGTVYNPAVKIRGGTGVVYNNRFRGSYPDTGEIEFDNQRDGGGVAPDCGTPVDTLCDGTATIDSAPSGRPTGTTGGDLCLDQVGGGSGLIGSQEEYALHVWGNTNVTSGSVAVGYNIVPCAAGCTTSPIQDGRDVKSTTKSGYTALQYPHPLRGVWGDSPVSPPTLN